MGKSIAKTKIRRLYVETSSEHTKIKILIFRTLQICTVLGILVGLAFNPELPENLLVIYRQQYNAVVYANSQYCFKQFDFKKLMSFLKEDFLSQDDALSTIEETFKMHTNFTAFAIVGATGVGKTLFVNLLEKQFPWRENVYHHFWLDISIDEKDMQIRKLDRIVRSLSTCGHNLVVIDNLAPMDKNLIVDFNRISKEYLQQYQINAIFFYVFNLLRYNELSKLDFNANLKSLHNLSEIKTINFGDLTKFDVKDCIRLESKRCNLTLNSKTIDEIAETIDYYRSGCKKVYSRIILYKP